MAERKMCEWLISLSDGRTFSKNKLIAEGKAAYGTVKAIVDAGEASITGFRLQREGLTHTAPSASPGAKFPSSMPFVIDHRMRAATDSNEGNLNYANYQVDVKNFTGTIKLWVDEQTGDTWLQLVAGERATQKPPAETKPKEAKKEAKNGA